MHRRCRGRALPAAGRGGPRRRRGRGPARSRRTGPRAPWRIPAAPATESASSPIGSVERVAHVRRSPRPAGARAPRPPALDRSERRSSLFEAGRRQRVGVVDGRTSAEASARRRAVALGIRNDQVAGRDDVARARSCPASAARGGTTAPARRRTSSTGRRPPPRAGAQLLPAARLSRGAGGGRRRPKCERRAPFGRVVAHRLTSAAGGGPARHRGGRFPHPVECLVSRDDRLDERVADDVALVEEHEVGCPRCRSGPAAPRAGPRSCPGEGRSA